MSHAVREEEMPISHEISFFFGNRRERVEDGFGGTVPPDPLVNCSNTVSDDILVRTIQHRFPQHACNSLFPNCGTVISWVSPISQNTTQSRVKSSDEERKGKPENKEGTSMQKIGYFGDDEDSRYNDIPSSDFAVTLELPSLISIFCSVLHWS